MKKEGDWENRKGELEMQKVESFDFSPPWRDGFNVLAPKGRKEKGVEANIDSLHIAGLGQGFRRVDCGIRRKWGEDGAIRVGNPRVTLETLVSAFNNGSTAD